MAEPRRLFRIRFTDKVDKKTITLTAAKVTVSDFFGLIAIEQLVFTDNSKQIVLPEEDSMRKRYAATKRLHVPYHNVVSIEEFVEEAPAPKLHKIPVLLRHDKDTPTDGITT